MAKKYGGAIDKGRPYYEEKLKVRKRSVLMEQLSLSRRGIFVAGGNIPPPLLGTINA
jgi:hypothetical protein